MADIIQLLPTSIADQIAAGEVVQRPASVVKELLENSIDAGAEHIKVIVKDAGKALIQVVDDGCGMSETDARMCFERHATSKIKAAKDLFAIRTMGFRGEALASISAVSQVELRTRRRSDELGSRLVVEASTVKISEPCQCSAGSNFSVKNLFYNIPARRNFLKSNPVEMRHIIDEFQRVALANPEVFFSLHHNQNETFHLQPSNLRQRIVGLFGNRSNKNLVPVEEETEALRLKGFIGKPEFAKKTRGDQYVFVNNRFIKSGYLNHAIMQAYEELLPKDSFPFYAIFLDIDPARIDINVHPTKQEIKFDDERLVYNYLKVSVRHALGRHNILPTIDFDQSPSLPMFGPTNFPKPRGRNLGGSTRIDRHKFNDPEKDDREDRNLKAWEALYQTQEIFDQTASDGEPEELEAVKIESKASGQIFSEEESHQSTQRTLFQFHNSYIISQIKSGIMLIDQQAAHERVLYERFEKMLEGEDVFSQKQLFPINIELSTANAAILTDILGQVNKLGFEVKPFGKNSFVIHSVPINLKPGQNPNQIIERLIEQYKLNAELDLSIPKQVARSMATSMAIKRGQHLQPEEIQELVDQLFACAMPYKSPGGRRCFITFELDALDKQFAS